MELCSAKSNMRSALQNPRVVDEYLRNETAKGNVLGPFSRDTLSDVHTNRFGVIPKPHQHNKWRLITDLSSPAGASVNDAIDPSLCSLSYISVDQAANAAMQLGRGSLLAKIDIKSAYRLIPVHPYDRKFLGMLWDQQLYVDCMLPFGLRSAPKIFSAVADALEWCVGQQGVEHICHYLDDFLTMGPPASPICEENLLALERLCASLGVPLAPDKRMGPSPVLTFLGIVIDTERGELRLPDDKLQRLMDTLKVWLARRTCTRKELESLIGVLSYACKVVRPGRSFLRRAISLLSVVKLPHHHVRLNAEFKADLSWWKAFASQWNGASVIISQGSPGITITSDASGSWGCGAWYESKWFSLEWQDDIRDKNITVKELIPIIIAAVSWGHLFRGMQVVSNCDNMAVVSLLNHRYSREADLMQLLRTLFFLEAHFQFQLSAVHIPGALNVGADDLSRNRAHAFRHKHPQAERYPHHIPSSLLQWLLAPGTEWTSPAWIRQFNIFVTRE